MGVTMTEQFKPVPVRGFGVFQLFVGFCLALLGLAVGMAPHLGVVPAKNLLAVMVSDMSGVDGRIGYVLYYGMAALIALIGIVMMRSTPDTTR